MRLRKLAEKAAEGDEEAKDDVALEAPQGLVNGMSLDEFIDKMVHYDDFAEEVYDRMSGPKYGSTYDEEPRESSEEPEESSEEPGGKGKIVRIVEHFNVSPDQVDELMEAITELMQGGGEEEIAHF